MPIKIEWDNPDQTILRWTFAGHWLWEEINALGNEVCQMLASVDHTVDVIIDFSDARALPRQLAGHPGAFPTQPDGDSMVVAVGSAAYAPALIQAARQLYSGNALPQVHIVPTVETARAFLTQMRTREAC